MINKEIKTITSKFVETFNPKTIYLFGSYARNDFNKDSDYDFYIVMPGKKKITVSFRAKAYVCIYGINKKPVDIVMNNETVFAERIECFDSLEKTILEEGVVLYEK
ncbi:MAG: nucleotidyltransferase domain-containing protein [Clostridia bacterium]|jgi:predicted nucleotidyltransferase|nr:nucleotidyltransferase domain-containing protein [Clostridia bacterium]